MKAAAKSLFLLILIPLITLLIQSCANTSPAIPTSAHSTDSPQKTNKTASHSDNSDLNTPTLLNKTHFKNTLVIETDNDKNSIKISTINGFKKQPRNKKQTWANNYITAVIDKNTGAISYQINSLIQYKDHDKHLYKEVNYRSGMGEKTAATSILNHDISCLGSAYSGCIHTEHIVFPIEATLIEALAASYTEGSKSTWRYSLLPKQGRRYSAHLFVAEIAALVEAVNEESLQKKAAN